MVQITKRDSNRCPTHPGELLREEIIPATGKTKVEIAQLLGISRQHLYDILRERKPVSPAVAAILGTPNARRMSAKFRPFAPKRHRCSVQ